MKPRKLVHGIGNNDAGYSVAKTETIGYVGGKRRQKPDWFCPYYRAWVNMLARCYSKKTQERQPTYKGCSVSKEWLTFSNFRAWMVTQDWQGKQLDKDLLIEGNKIYSAETCVFVSPLVNTFTKDNGSKRGERSIGAYWDKSRKKFRSKCSNPFTKKKEHLGLFPREQEAHEAWLKRKLELARELAAIQEDPRVAKALVDRYSNQGVTQPRGEKHVMIKKGIPVPESTRRGRPAKYPFADMEIWDCYEVTDPDQVKRAAKAAFRYGARHGMKFSTRTTNEGMRIWRIA